MKILLKHFRGGSGMGLLMLTLLTVALLSGCGKRQSIADKRYYRWQPDVSWVQPLANQHAETLYVPRALALGVVGSRPILARTGDGSLVQMHHHFWLDSPRVMWQNTLLDWAGKKSAWAEVRDIKPIHPHHFTLHSAVLALEKDGKRAHLALRVELLDANKRLRYQSAFDRQQDLPDNSMGAFVNAINALSEAILREMDAGINQVLVSDPPHALPDTRTGLTSDD